MTTKTETLDGEFLARQGSRLLKLRDDLMKTVQATQREETEINEQSLGDAHEHEDDAQKLALLEIDGNLEKRNNQRLVLVERALKKIDDGTYGVSDVSGKPISKARLEAIPEAIRTLEEEAAAENGR
ncbi:MAG: TraR/DksA family transcriptional regulator [Rudaea sp.]